MEIRVAALRLLDMSAVTDLQRVSFSAGGGAVLESMKIARRSSDREWLDGECPVFDPAKALYLCGIPLIYDGALPVDWLSVMVDGRYIAGAHVDLSAGCSAGIAPVREPKLKPKPEVAVKELPRRRATAK